jgi:tetratricopeptide (TPR) repeat protein
LFGLLGLLLYAVIFVLPRWFEERRPREDSLSDGATPPVSARAGAPLSAEQLEAQDHFQARAQQELARVTQLRRQLDARRAAQWGGDVWTRAVASMDEGDEHLAATNYAGADGAYAEAIRMFEAVEARAPGVFARALADGNAALAANDSAAAAAAFELALSLSPDASVAADGLERAGRLDEVAALLDKGKSAERDGDLDGARDRYARAARLDPMSRPAQEALARVTDRIDDAEFAGAMSDGLAALERGEYEAADEAFRRAAALRPAASQVADALLRVEQTAQLDRILEHGARARAFEEQERWSDALEQYDAVLAIDDTVRFAVEGHRRAAAHADLFRRLDHHIAHPDRLSTDAVYDEAELLLAEVSEAGVAGPQLTSRIVELQRLLDRAGTRMRVVLESDRMTEVTVYKVGRLGRFERHALELRPGTYTVVGSRQGYRDVRLRLVVEPSGAPAPLSVRCTEEI